MSEDRMYTKVRLPQTSIDKVESFREENESNNKLIERIMYEYSQGLIQRSSTEGQNNTVDSLAIEIGEIKEILKLILVAQRKDNPLLESLIDQLQSAKKRGLKIGE